MEKAKIKVYTYTRVSTAMQVDGYSLDAQKAREGRWVGGFAPYEYRLVNGALEINEEEAEAIRIIFDRYLHTDMGSNGIARYLANQGIHKIERQNGKNSYFDAALIRRIIQNPVYCGKIAYGRRRTEKVHGTRNDYHLVEKDDYILVDGRHEGIISEDDWHAAQVKAEAQAKKYEHVNRGKNERIHLLTGIVKCPLCSAGMYGNKSVKHRDGKKYNIYKILFYFDKMYAVMDEAERRRLMESLIDEIQIYEERQPNGQWLKSIRFKLPIIDEDMSLSLDNDSHIEVVSLLQRMSNTSKKTITLDVDMEDYHRIKSEGR